MENWDQLGRRRKQYFFLLISEPILNSFIIDLKNKEEYNFVLSVISPPSLVLWFRNYQKLKSNISIIALLPVEERPMIMFEILNKINIMTIFFVIY